MGLNKGEVTDLLKLSDAISKAVEKAEEMAGFRISNVTCNVTGGFPFTQITSDNMQISDNLIKKEDVLNLFDTLLLSLQIYVVTLIQFSTQHF